MTHDTQRLRDLFRQALTMTASATLLAACGSTTVAPPDTDAGPADTGVVTDTGNPPVDAGNPPVDAGNPPVDTGNPPVDTGCERVVVNANTCQAEALYPCGLPPGFEYDAGTSDNLSFTSAQCRTLCPETQGGPIGGFCNGQRETGGAVRVRCTFCAIGRRPEGYSRAEVVGRGSPTGVYFAEAAALEWASVPAFERLAAELRAHGAPAGLVEAAEAAVEDERRHTRMTAALARRGGASVRLDDIAVGPVRPLEAVALENAVEGCVRETFGALVASWQGLHAEDPVVARAMDAIAEDETRHAELAWAVAAWITPLLSPTAQARVEAARDAAVEALCVELATPVDAVLVRETGMPACDAALRLAEHLRASLWETEAA